MVTMLLQWRPRACEIRAHTAEIMTRTVGQTFTYDPLPAEEFLARLLAAGAEPAYMKSVYQNYSNLSAGKAVGADETFDNFRELVGRDANTIEQAAVRLLA